MLAIKRSCHYHSGSIAPGLLVVRATNLKSYVISLNLKFVAWVVAIMPAAFLSFSAHADGDPERGENLGATCLGCHGIEGYRNAYPSYRVPRLGGQRAAYIEGALKAYRDGTRPHPTMQAQGSSLTDQDIEDIIAWIGRLPAATDQVDAEALGGLEAAKACIACHGPGGESVTPAPPVLSGQHADYLRHALTEYKEQQRGNNVMNSFAAGLTDADVRAIAAFYSSREGLHTLSDDE
jgi:cytochrome c553